MPSSPPITPKIVFDASALVGALLREDSVPERALLLARAHAVLCLSNEVEAEIRAVFARPKFSRYLRPGRADRIIELVTSGAHRVEPHVEVNDCRDKKDNKYLA